MSRFDLQRHNIRKLTLAEAVEHYKSTKSPQYKLKLRMHLKLADARLRGLIAQGKRSRAVAQSPTALAGIDAMRRDAALIADTLRTF